MHRKGVKAPCDICKRNVIRTCRGPDPASGGENVFDLPLPNYAVRETAAGREDQKSVLRPPLPSRFSGTGGTQVDTTSTGHFARFRILWVTLPTSRL